jgi:hypothetical protein
MKKEKGKRRKEEGEEPALLLYQAVLRFSSFFVLQLLHSAGCRISRQYRASSHCKMCNCHTDTIDILLTPHSLLTLDYTNPINRIASVIEV